MDDSLTRKRKRIFWEFITLVVFGIITKICAYTTIIAAPALLISFMMLFVIISEVTVE